jgi:hypothetical protein
MRHGHRAVGDVLAVRDLENLLWCERDVLVVAQKLHHNTCAQTTVSTNRQILPWDPQQSPELFVQVPWRDVRPRIPAENLQHLHLFANISNKSTNRAPKQTIIHIGAYCSLLPAQLAHGTRNLRFTIIVTMLLYKQVPLDNNVFSDSI